MAALLNSDFKPEVDFFHLGRILKSFIVMQRKKCRRFFKMKFVFT